MPPFHNALAPDFPRRFSSTSTPQAPSLQVNGDAPPWVHEVAGQLSALLRMSAGWRGTPSAAIEPRLAEDAINRVLSAVMPSDLAPIPHVVPRADGGLQLEWHQGGWDIEVLLSPLGGIYIDAASDGDHLDWDGDFVSRREDLALLLQSIAA